MLSTPELYDPTRALTEDWRSFFFERREDMFILPCIEGDIELQGNWMHLNIMITMPLIRRRRPISMYKHLLTEGIYGQHAHATVMSRIARSLEEAGYTREEIGHDIIMTVNNAHNMCYSHLGGFIQTIDAASIAKTILQPEVKPVVTPNYGDITSKDIKRMEKIFKDQSEVVETLLSGDTLEHNVFRAPLICGAVKKAQFIQFVFSAGPKTDTNDDLFLRPVVGSFLSGFTSVMDVAIESRSAAKATHYNSTQMAQAQYGNRKLHIQNCTMRYLYRHDCGSQRYADYTPTDKTVAMYIGKFFLGEDGQLVELTRERSKDVVNKSLKFRSVNMCRHTDGYCEVCGGTITKTFPTHGNVGFLSIVNTGAPVAQQVLSTKHLTSTNAAEYRVPDALESFLTSMTEGVYVRPAYHRRMSIMAFGFQPDDISKINDLRYIAGESEIGAAYFSSITYLQLGILQADGTVAKNGPRVPMKGGAKIYPHLSQAVLDTISAHPEDVIIQDGLAWVLMRNVDPMKPIMRCTVTNNSIKLYVSEFTKLVTIDVERYRSINRFMRDLSGKVWERVPSHLTHIECLARNCMITSRRDFNIPVVDDPENVTFGSLSRIIPMRSIGALYAFERIDQATNKPVTFITPKRHGVLDEFMGYTDIIQRDMNWPVPASGMGMSPLG